MQNRIYSNELSKHEGELITIKGWLHVLRKLGSIAFLIIRDKNGLAQVVLEKAEEIAKLENLYTGTVSIYVDDELKGTATDNSDFAEINPITPGEHTIALKKESNGNYYQFVKKVNFEPGLDVVVAYDLGPSQLFSEGHILYTRKNFLSIKNPRLSVYSSPEETSVFLDDILVGTTVIKDLELDKSVQHKLRFEKKGYDTMEIIILPENLVDREKLSNYDIVLEVNLFLQPVKINYQL